MSSRPRDIGLSRLPQSVLDLQVAVGYVHVVVDSMTLPLKSVIVKVARRVNYRKMIEMPP